MCTEKMAGFPFVFDHTVVQVIIITPVSQARSATSLELKHLSYVRFLQCSVQCNLLFRLNLARNL
jgi:hypothetical protein